MTGSSCCSAILSLTEVCGLQNFLSQDWFFSYLLPSSIRLPIIFCVFNNPQLWLLRGGERQGGRVQLADFFFFFCKVVTSIPSLRLTAGLIWDMIFISHQSVSLCSKKGQVPIMWRLSVLSKRTVQPICCLSGHRTQLKQLPSLLRCKSGRVPADGTCNQKHWQFNEGATGKWICELG